MFLPSTISVWIFENPADLNLAARILSSFFSAHRSLKVKLQKKKKNTRSSTSNNQEYSYTQQTWRLGNNLENRSLLILFSQVAEKERDRFRVKNRHTRFENRVRQCINFHEKQRGRWVIRGSRCRVWILLEARIKGCAGCCAKPLR